MKRRPLGPALRGRLSRAAGTLTRASKMPGPCAPSLSTDVCVTGSKLRQNAPESPCAACYARRLEKARPNVARAWRRNLEALQAALASPGAARRWVYATAALLLDEAVQVGDTRVRWFVGGDIQSDRHLRLIFRVAHLTPELRHRVPTSEWSLLRAYTGSVPPNVRLQASLPTIGTLPMGSTWTLPVQVTAVHRDLWSCPATDPAGEHRCGDCDKCWDPAVPAIIYRLH